jgi:SOS-response transcriptional repressor LexA
MGAHDQKDREMRSLSIRQKEYFNWIYEYIKTNKVCPSTQEIMVGMGVRSPACVTHAIKKLVEKGFLEKKGKFRSLIIADQEKQ